MLFFALAWCVPFLSIAQKLDPALKALVAKGLQKSHSVNAFELDAKLAKVDQNLAKSVFLPKVTGGFPQFVGRAVDHQPALRARPLDANIANGSGGRRH